jgi:hypothetical protein
MITSNPNSPTFLFDNLPLHWQMTRCEKFAFASILQVAKPDISIEVGTYQGGSLQMISQYSKKVYSIDVLSDCKDKLGGHFTNVEFYTGDSKILLQNILNRITENQEPLGFVLIDGDHSTEGVKSDVNAVLEYVPIRPVYIVFHDSFHPRSRKGLLAASWEECPYVHYVEIDFIPGVFHFEAFDTAKPRSMYGGLALAVMYPEKRIEPLTIHQSQKGLFDTIFRNSRHAREEKPDLMKILRRVKRKFKFVT